MLALTIKPGEHVFIDGQAGLNIGKVKVRLGFDFPRDVVIVRESAKLKHQLVEKQTNDTNGNADRKL